jgi:hypothetical protein
LAKHFKEKLDCRVAPLRGGPAMTAVRVLAAKQA